MQHKHFQQQQPRSIQVCRRALRLILSSVETICVEPLTSIERTSDQRLLSTEPESSRSTKGASTERVFISAERLSIQVKMKSLKKTKEIVFYSSFSLFSSSLVVGSVSIECFFSSLFSSKSRFLPEFSGHIRMQFFVCSSLSLVD